MMPSPLYLQGSLFAQDLLDSSITEFPEWKAYDDHDLATLRLKQLHRAAIQVPSLEAFRNLLDADE